jgi:exosortase
MRPARYRAANRFIRMARRNRAILLKLWSRATIKACMASATPGQVQDSKTLNASLKHRNVLQLTLAIVVFAMPWWMLIAYLSQHWSVDSQYSFGWLVPVICAYLFVVRWRTRPPAEPARSAIPRWVFWSAGFTLLPTWLVAQPNPDWRLIGWIFAVEVVSVSLCAVYFLGGRSWLRYFAFSVCFILTSVPWLRSVEGFVVQGLTQAATVVTVAALHLFRIAAVQHGNVIELKSGLLGFDEACGGIRSLQATFVVSLFFCEIYRGPWPRRILLVLCGALVAFLCNVGRTIALSAVAAKNGVEAISSWHDPLGFAAFAFSLVVVWGIARLISGPPPKLMPSKAADANVLPRGLAFSFGAWILFTVVGTEIWYRSHETTGGPQWSFAWPVNKRDYSDVKLSERESDALACDEKRAAEWTSSDGIHWTVFFFSWAKGPSKSRILARMHRPENCLPAVGYKLGSDRGNIIVKAPNLSIPFHALDFEYTGDHLYVFFCLWEDGLRESERPWIQDEWTPVARLVSVLFGKRNLGQQMLEVVISGYGTPEEADAAFRREITGMIQTVGF